TFGGAVQNNQVFTIIDNDDPITDTILDLFTDSTGVVINNNDFIAEDLDLNGDGSFDPKGTGTGPVRGGRVRYNFNGTNNDVVIKYESVSNFPNRALTPEVTSGQAAVLSGNVGEPDFGDEWTLEVKWGDGSPTETFTSPPGTNGRPVSLPHVFVNNDP